MALCLQAYFVMIEVTKAETVWFREFFESNNVGKGE